ncbi:aspartate/methionine/tyrosine aminotransferase [Paraburkholderia unamae]|uniref:pyridoxal phosphate-dependent aminotransferase n=1 Tax=Paraburkholderia unamae TaxID=219649 RepID=UPI000DC5C18E|nr:pyridoxal phosphate-dependent aminotransferase [Paraburkholderia unamae]RAR52275.1 aspartate/methionine/tyrosine aminotransferase [Paraburkholderia unamae]
MSTTPSLSQHARSAVQALRSSKIREVANAGMGRTDVLPFWFGEPDEPTPADVRSIAAQRLTDGDTFYVQTLGLPALREAIAAYISRLHRPHAPFDAGQVAVTSSGTTALMLAMQAIINPGDRVVAITPLWPNLVEMPKVLGAQVETVSLHFCAGGSQLDLDALLDALRPGTRALLVNSPNNPSGWVMSAQAQRTVLEHCRKHGIWIVTDDVYERYYYDNAHCAPSFLDLADASDRVISCNSFSKAWLMTGWRIGWIVVPSPLLPEIGKLIEFSTTCTPGFLQHAALHALEHGEPVIARTVARLKQSRDLLAARLAEVPRVQLAAPSPGAMYTFFRVGGVTDSLAFCKQLVAEGGLGLAPGAAFGPEGEGFLRWCYASTPERIEAGVERLTRYLDKHR